MRTLACHRKTNGCNPSFYPEPERDRVTAVDDPRDGHIRRFGSRRQVLCTHDDDLKLHYDRQLTISDFKRFELLRYGGATRRGSPRIFHHRIAFEWDRYREAIYRQNFMSDLIFTSSDISASPRIVCRESCYTAGSAVSDTTLPMDDSGSK